MQIAKVFSNGRSQAVRLPKECRFNSGETEVYVHKLEGMVMLVPKKTPWEPLLRSLGQFSDDFMDERSQPLTKDSRKNLL